MHQVLSMAGTGLLGTLSIAAAGVASGVMAAMAGLAHLRCVAIPAVTGGAASFLFDRCVHGGARHPSR